MVDNRLHKNEPLIRVPSPREVLGGQMVKKESPKVLSDKYSKECASIRSVDKRVSSP
jgi:hypothetical protein